jgi:hypothetical protein
VFIADFLPNTHVAVVFMNGVQDFLQCDPMVLLFGCLCTTRISKSRKILRSFCRAEGNLK